MNKQKIYSGLGFVEALAAILVTGMASIALMTLAARTLSETIQNEVTDTMTQYAIEGVEMVQVIADLERITGNEDLFPDELQITEDTCFILNNDVENPSFYTDESGVMLSFPYLQRETFKELAIIEADDEYFRVFCRISYSDVSDNLVVGKVIVGLVDREGTIENGTLVFDPGGILDVDDYEYFTIVKLK